MSNHLIPDYTMTEINTTNGTLIPSAKDLLMVIPRLAQYVYHLPQQMDSVYSKIRSGGSMITDATAMNTTTAIITNTSSTAAQTSAAVVQAASESVDTGFFSWFMNTFNFEGAGFGGMFSYFSSRWALATFAVVRQPTSRSYPNTNSPLLQSIFLNRTHFYASSRQNLNLRWKTRILIYSIPIVLMLTETLFMLRAMKCQTSPDYSLYRYGDPDKKLAVNAGGDGGFMYNLSSMLLFWENDAASCSAMNMSLKDNNKLKLVGSFSLVWPFFITLCVSQFVETLACALQGRQPMPETGMTTFEHSLAFAECEAMISSALGLGVFSTKADRSGETGTGAADTVLMTKTMILRYMNVPSEVLLICVISCFSHLSSAILAATGYRQKFRLVNTGIWALCYISAFIWSFARVLNSPIESEADLGILRLPTVCIIGFVPHIMILLGISICVVIYGLALLLTATSLPAGSPSNPTLKERFSIAYNNLQANVQFSSSSSIRLNWQEDFYTTLLKVGFNILTAASEAVYLNEGSAVTIHEMTWLEQKRFNELSSSGSRRIASRIPSELLGDSIAKGIEYTDHESQSSQSGYARERKSRTAKQSEAAQTGALDSGLGLVERRNRWQLMGEYFKGIGLLFGRIMARLMLDVLGKIGIEHRPAFLINLAGVEDKSSERSQQDSRPRTRDFWLASADGLTLPEDSNVDVEIETRKRLHGFNPSLTEENLDSNLYRWWKTGGWWGELDSSGDYTIAPSELDDDTTSVVSMSTNASATGSDSEASSSGRRTPTQEDPFPLSTRTNENPINVADLARLLDPKTPQDREEAQMLSRHLNSSRPMTRSQYKRGVNMDKARLLHSSADNIDGETALESYILERRAAVERRKAGEGSWMSGAEGMGAGGPQCVVCQSSPRVILVFPCMCLSICDDCRVGVAARNFSNCLCCRTPVAAYSRMYVP